MAIKCEGKVAAIGGVKPLDALAPEALASRQFEACLKYLPLGAEVGKAQSSAPGQQAPPQREETGKPLTKGQKRRTQLERAAQTARAEERDKFQRNVPPQAQGNG